jgi:hypothetical protein
MSPPWHFFLLPVFLAAVSADAYAACGAQDDFLSRADPSLAPVHPSDCLTLTQTPPEFTWPPRDTHANYTLSLKFPDGRVEKRSSTRNFIIWPRALPPGNYSWTVKGTGRSTDESQPRSFTIARGATEFVIPSGVEALERARRTPRPRSWTADGTSPLVAAKGERAGGLRELVAQAEQKMRSPLPPEPASRSKDSNYDDVVAEGKRTMASAFGWAATHQPALGADGARRLMNMAAWNTRGPVGYAANDMASRTIAWTLALGYDWMHDYLNTFQKAAIVSSIRAHAQPMFDDIGPRISKYPMDSHGNVSLTLLAAIGALMAGELPEADEWLKSTISMALAWTSPWGEQDGGFANGTAQMFWDTGSNLPAWYVFRSALGVDLAKKDWVRNLGRAMAYFIPPGTPSGLFGDGQELQMQEYWARVAKAYASFAPSPLARWYARQMKGEDTSRLELLLAPKPEPGIAMLPGGIDNGALFPSIGWVAMHSDLADPLRTSVYFKSSPYGSHNHSHGDQNSFVVNHRGKRLAIASGYYDGYRTPHWTQWYKVTRSANAITFDHGQGQGFNELRFSGDVVAFQHTPAFDYAVGRAEKAYAGFLTLAQRSIAYLRPGTIVVYDSLASQGARTWEWNIHALERMTRHADNRISIVNGDASLCVEMLASPPVEFAQTDQFTAPPEDRKMVNQWHGAFATTRKFPRAEFIALMRVDADCARPSGATATRAGGGWHVAVDGRTIAFAGETVSLK